MRGTAISNAEAYRLGWLGLRTEEAKARLGGGGTARDDGGGREGARSKVGAAWKCRCSSVGGVGRGSRDIGEVERAGGGWRWAGGRGTGRGGEAGEARRGL